MKPWSEKWLHLYDGHHWVGSADLRVFWPLIFGFIFILRTWSQKTYFCTQVQATVVHTSSGCHDLCRQQVSRTEGPPSPVEVVHHHPAHAGDSRQGSGTVAASDFPPFRCSCVQIDWKRGPLPVCVLWCGLHVLVKMSAWRHDVATV